MRTFIETHSVETRLPKTWRCLPPSAVALLVLAVFVPALAAGFVGWDDDDLLLNEARYRTLSWDNLAWMFTTSYTGHFQPLTWLSYWFDVRLWSLDPFGFHFANVALHMGCAVTFFFIVRRLVIEARTGLTARQVQWGATLATVLFATHPLRVESVAWIAERRDVLSAFFFLLSIACYLRYAGAGQCDGQSPRASKATWYVAMLLCCAVSLLAKATAVMLPLVLWVLDVYPLRRFGEARSKSNSLVWTDKLPLLAMSVVAGVRAVLAQREQGAMVPFAEHDFPSRVIQAGYGLIFYLWKSVAPMNLGPLYELPSRDVLIQGYAWSWLGVVALAVTAIAVRRSLPAVTAAIAVYVVMLAPVLGLAQSGPQLVADRYSYLACTGFAIIAGVAAVRGGAWLAARRRSNLRAAYVLSAAVVLTLLQHATLKQCDVWRSALALWSHGVRVSPNSAIAHANYADALAATGDLRGATAHYARSLDLRPGDPITTHHLADVLRASGDVDRAISMYVRTLQLDSTRSEAHFSLARLLIDQGRGEQAALVMRERLRRVPDDRRAAAFLAEVNGPTTNEPGN